MVFWSQWISFRKISSKNSAKELKKNTLDFGIVVAPGTFGEKIKRSPYNKHPPYHQTEDILKKKYALPSLIRNVAPGKKSKE